MKERRRICAFCVSPVVLRDRQTERRVELSCDTDLLALLDAGRLRNATRDPQPVSLPADSGHVRAARAGGRSVRERDAFENGKISEY